MIFAKKQSSLRSQLHLTLLLPPPPKVMGGYEMIKFRKIKVKDQSRWGGIRSTEPF